MLVACFSANVVARHSLRELLIKMQLIWLQEISQEISDIFCLALSLSKEGGKSWRVIFNKGGGGEGPGLHHVENKSNTICCAHREPL